MQKRSDWDVDELLRAFASGEIDRRAIVRALRGDRAEESSVPGLLAHVFPGVALRWRNGRVRCDHLAATEVQLERAKYRLVEALFPDAATFERVDRELFPGFPLMGVPLGDGRVAIIDGHHRARRFCSVAAPGATLGMQLLTTSSPQVSESYLRQVVAVEQVNGSAAILALPIKP